VPSKLLWREISPFVYMNTHCDQGKTVLIYSHFPNLVLIVDGKTISAKESIVAHNMILKHGKIDTLQILRYEFCLPNTLSSFMIQSKTYSSESIDIKRFISNNLGLYIDHTDSVSLKRRASYIEAAETQRSYTLKAIDEHSRSLGFSFSQAEVSQAEVPQPKAVQTKTSSPTLPFSSSSANSQVAAFPSGSTSPATQPTPSSLSTLPSLMKSSLREVAAKPVTSYYHSGTFIPTTAIPFNPDSAVFNQAGYGYKIQILAKKMDNHNEKTVKTYYHLPYFIDEHYDGTWHRFTLSGYSSDYEQIYRQLKEIQGSYDIEDAFISLYQNFTRVGIISYAPADMAVLQLAD